MEYLTIAEYAQETEVTLYQEDQERLARLCELVCTRENIPIEQRETEKAYRRDVYDKVYDIGSQAVVDMLMRDHGEAVEFLNKCQEL